jgi:hypothetical protein
MGDLRLRQNPSAPDRAEDSYRLAIERARSQEAKSWEAPRRHQPRPAMGRSRQARRGAGALGAGLRLVHRGLRHCRSERSEEATRRAEVSRASPCPASGADDRFWATRRASRGSERLLRVPKRCRSIVIRQWPFTARPCRSSMSRQRTGVHPMQAGWTAGASVRFCTNRAVTPRPAGAQRPRSVAADRAAGTQGRWADHS